MPPSKGKSEPQAKKVLKMPDGRTLEAQYVNHAVELPYGLTVAEVASAVDDTYRLLDGVDAFLTGNGFRHLEELILGNSLSGLVSEFPVKNIASASPALDANLKVGGHPDLLPHGKYGTGGVLKASEGIEVKASVQRGGWQGHNPEDCWVLVFRYVAGHYKESAWVALHFVEIMCARLAKSDWSYSGRKGESRRTPTASITRSGVEKLRRNYLYRLPGVGVAMHRSVLATPPPREG
jgi:hypothetical protein